jgi:hypothetical protein
MSGWAWRTAGTALAVVLAVLGTATLAVPALAAPRPIGDCTTTSGVIVAVDYGHWGGPVLRSCGTTPTTGYDLLNQGGWQTTGTEHDGPGFVCRIGYSGYQGGTQYPTPSEQSCVLTPPANAYWAFWYANPGQNVWNYSQTGATGIQPEPGSVELWTFGGTNVGGTSGSAVPAITPAALRAENTRPAGNARRHAAHSVSRQPAAPAQTASQAAAPATPSHRTTAAASTDPSAKATIVNAPPSAASAASVNHGSAAPAIIALVIVLVLAAVGITAVLRRPRRDQ